ncbi:MAG: nuclear transport factor 2 family protein [Alphaproteobacteria bacterium]|nr:nuclear transport factor 2 family protein [Alphaproteobacteria bacterium]
MDEQKLTKWLAAYKRSWEQQDADLFVKLFTPDCEYRENPFIEPVPGREFHAFWQALAQRQQDNRIEFEILGPASGNRAVVNWMATSTRRETQERRQGNGIFLLTFDAAGLCSDLREWQHAHPVGAPLEKRVFAWPKS